jgi:pimeloyl-ACP methyl ester carboxylesterase
MNSLVRLFIRTTSPRASHEPARTTSRRRLLSRIGSLAAFAAVVALSPAAHAQAGNAAPTQIRNVVLVHGLFADGSSWGKVIPPLQARGLHVTSVQNPLTACPTMPPP